jgi:hypothetical protein
MEGKNTATKTLLDAAELLSEREKTYGDPAKNFARIARIASVILDRRVSRYEIAAIMVAVKLGRVPNDPAYADSYDDAINYLAFMKMFSEEHESVRKFLEKVQSV